MRTANVLRMTANVSEELGRALDEAGAIVRERFPWWLRPFVMRGVVAITLGRRIYMRDEIPATGHSIEPLLWHELTHVRQMRDHGLLRFGWRYLTEYFRNIRSGMDAGEAYRNISYE